MEDALAQRINMDMHDRRVKRTQNLLVKALIALSLEKGYEAVTIRDITERADIGYATFFRHYHDKDALLHDVLDVVLAELIGLLPPSTQDSDPIATGTLIFSYVQQHNEIIRVLLSSRGSSSLLHHMIETGTQSVLSHNTPEEDSTVPPEIAAYHAVTSTIALIQWWLEHDMPYSPERMGTIYHELIARPTRSVAFDA
jgi:AcrR family transcriptional regulator